MPRILIAALMVVCLPALAQAELPDSYRQLLAEADRRDTSDERFVEIADMVSVLVPGGRAEVHQAILDHFSNRADAFAAWPLPEPAPAETQIEEAPHEEHRSIEAPVVLGEAPEGSGGWLAAPLRALQSDTWSGHVSFGVNVERGNSELTDFTFAVELDREFQHGWQLDSQFEYFFSENSVATTRDNWLAEARVSRELDSGVGYYAGGSYERDEIGLYQASAFVTAGGIWHVLSGAKADWQLRAGAGQRYREPALGGETLTDWVGEAGSSFTYAFSDTVEFASETTGFIGGGSRIDQRFRLTSRLFGDWALQTGLRIEHEFEDRPGFEPTDTRLDISLLYGF